LQVAKHQLMHREAASFGVPVIEVQGYLDSCTWSGFLWWDYVHMTDYGYSLFAKKLSPDIINALNLYYPSDPSKVERR
jgi:hypothetical protein